MGTKPTAARLKEMSEGLDAVSEVVSKAEIAEMLSNPALTSEALFGAIVKSLGRDLPKELEGLLSVVVENKRLSALPEIAFQFRELKNRAAGVADAYIESAFEMTAAQVSSLVESLEKKFPGVKLNPIVTVNPELIGGVSVRVGDQILDGSVRARLAQMQASLTA